MLGKDKELTATNVSQKHDGEAAPEGFLGMKYSPGMGGFLRKDSLALWEADNSLEDGEDNDGLATTCKSSDDESEDIITGVSTAIVPGTNGVKEREKGKGRWQEDGRERSGGCALADSWSGNLLTEVDKNRGVPSLDAIGGVTGEQERANTVEAGRSKQATGKQSIKVEVGSGKGRKGGIRSQDSGGGGNEGCSERVQDHDVEWSEEFVPAGMRVLWDVSPTISGKL